MHMQLGARERWRESPREAQNEGFPPDAGTLLTGGYSSSYSGLSCLYSFFLCAGCVCVWTLERSIIPFRLRPHSHTLLLLTTARFYRLLSSYQEKLYNLEKDYEMSRDTVWEKK